MSEQSNPSTSNQDRDPDARREEFAEVDEKVDEQSDGDGLDAEVGRGEEMGLAEG